MSAGSKFGRAVGIAGAFVVEGAVRTALSAGQFGQDAFKGAEEGFVEKHTELLGGREQWLADAAAKREIAVREHRARLAIARAEPTAEVAVPVKRRTAKASS